ncbi:SMC family ATPase [Levilactobacillus zymae]|uniref:SMC family ATPase n=1 Tax=Levilactobacillus zymae TaxID=267363 RepID=UPI0028B6D14C|nr:SMC family ATPase [Levilactobacillus zymae]MDT6981308.1 SMC family ATPase [Levilactobacillus zymae]
MTPLSLHLEFFGPYRDTTVDFTKFTATPLFLISGKTGSGKTTIFDGMCYALFDQTSGTDREATAMRSDFATIHDRTRVTFEFTHRDRRYQIVREPAQTLAKKRGTGVTPVTASVTLTVWHNQAEERQLTKIGQVREFLQDLLQMDGKQFAQIVLLPQGQFRRFLVADSDAKAQVLEQLFDTEIYARWAEKLKAKLRQSQQANRAALAELTHVQNELQWDSTNQAAAADLQSNHQADDLLKLMAQQQATTQAHEQATLTQLTTAQQVVTRLTKQETQEEQFLADQRRLAAAQTTQATLIQREPAMAQLQTKLAELEWVQGIQPHWQAWQTAQAAVSQRQASQQQQAQRVTQAQDDLTQAQAAQQAAADLPDQLTALRDQLARQATVKPLYQQIAALQDRQTAAQTAQQQTQAAVQRLTAALQATAAAQKQNQAIIAQQGTWYDQSQARQQTATTYSTWQQRLAQLTTDRQALKDQADQLTDLQARVTVAQDTADQAQATAEERYQARLRSQIAELSAQLTPGSPCPVCGATTHPHPATHEEIPPVTATQVKQAQQAATQAQQTATQLATQLSQGQTTLARDQAAFQTALATLRQAMVSSLPVTTETPLSELVQSLTQAQDANQHELDQVNQQLDRGRAAQAQLDRLQTTERAQQADLTQAQAAAQAAQTQLDRLDAQLTTQQAQLPADALTLHEFNELEETRQARLAALQRKADTLQQRVTQATQALAVAKSESQTATHELEQSVQQVATTRTTLTQVLAKHELTLTATTTATLTQQLAELAQLPTYRQQLQTFRTARTQNNATIAELQQRLADRPQPDRDQTQTALAAAQKRVAQLQDERYATHERWQRNATLVSRLQQQLTNQATALQQTQELDELSGVINGDGPNSKLGLERYVLQTYLRQILLVGNQRLRQLTNGRYQFVIDDTPTAAKKYSGLEINVYDDHVGEQRSVHTLSGGESFIAALALALALGEVIQRTTGSVDVDALFIDEGFGSLDEDALMTALESLETVEGQHRMIGIISHVSELRAQVPNQLQVIAQGNGESQLKYQIRENG